MKKLSVFLILGLSLSAKAKHVTPSELAGLSKCTKEQCFQNDGGKSFLRDCEFESMPPEITVLGPLYFENKSCYCPCTYDYLGGAARE